jgi:hypothetical protein
VGIRVQFKPDAKMNPEFRYLRGTPAIILTGLRLMTEVLQWRQQVIAFGAIKPEDRYGWALPGQLEIIPGDPDDPARQRALSVTTVEIHHSLPIPNSGATSFGISAPNETKNPKR